MRENLTKIEQNTLKHKFLGKDIFMNIKLKRQGYLTMEFIHYKNFISLMKCQEK